MMAQQNKLGDMRLFSFRRELMMIKVLEIPPHQATKYRAELMTRRIRGSL
jgi:hypothetical protein